VRGDEGDLPPLPPPVPPAPAPALLAESEAVINEFVDMDDVEKLFTKSSAPLPKGYDSEPGTRTSGPIRNNCVPCVLNRKKH